MRPGTVINVNSNYEMHKKAIKRKMKKIPKKIQDDYWIYGKYVLSKYGKKIYIYIDGIKLQAKSSLSDAVEFIDNLNKKIIKQSNYEMDNK